MSLIEVFLWLEVLDSVRSTSHVAIDPHNPIHTFLGIMVFISCVIVITFGVHSTVQHRREEEDMRRHNEKVDEDYAAYLAALPKDYKGPIRPRGLKQRWDY